jgi:hypothetical protein
VREIERLTEHDMVAAFLRAELHSERFGGRVRAALERQGVPVHAIEQPDTADPVQNGGRLAVLRDYRPVGGTPGAAWRTRCTKHVRWCRRTRYPQQHSTTLWMRCVIE